MEILMFLYLFIGVIMGGISLGSTVDEGLTKGRLIMIILFLPQTIVVGMFFLVAVGIIWIYDAVKYSDHKFFDWWKSPVRTKK